MDIPNLSPQPLQPSVSVNKNQLPVYLIIGALAIATGFWLSRLLPSKNNSIPRQSGPSDEKAISAETVKEASELIVGRLYGDTSTNFKDSATGTIEKGSINGEGTHILNRQGGQSQRASLTSSVLDLDLFVNRKVEVRGETNSSNKTGWLMDVGSVKLIE